MPTNAVFNLDIEKKNVFIASIYLFCAKIKSRGSNRSSINFRSIRRTQYIGYAQLFGIVYTWLPTWSQNFTCFFTVYIPLDVPTFFTYISLTPLKKKLLLRSAASLKLVTNRAPRVTIYNLTIFWFPLRMFQHLFISFSTLTRTL